MFEILEHPADIGFRAFGGTLEELFANAAVALVSIACEIEEVAPRTEYALSAPGTDYETPPGERVRRGAEGKRGAGAPRRRTPFPPRGPDKNSWLETCLGGVRTRSPGSDS